MAANVLSWSVAIDKGFKSGLYPYDDVPLGEFEAILDCKIWAKKIMGICCYFTHAATLKKFQLTVYCKHDSGAYKIEGCDLDFTQCPTGRVYMIFVIANERKKIVFVHARLI